MRMRTVVVEARKATTRTFASDATHAAREPGQAGGRERIGVRMRTVVAEERMAKTWTVASDATHAAWVP